jgi:hypothetical protein
MTDYRIEAATKEEWAERALKAEARVKELDAEIAKWRAAFIAQTRKLQGQTDDRSPPDS